MARVGGACVLLTRPLADSRDLAERLEAAGLDPLLWPLTRIVPVMEALKLPPTVGGLLFTSANGARAFASLNPRRDLPVLCVGAATAAVARGLGFLNAFPAGGDAAALAQLAKASGIGHFLHPRGTDVAADLAALIGPGQRVSEAVVYSAAETGPPPAPVRAALSAGRIDAIPIWSARNAAILARHLAGLAAPLQATRLIAISPAAAAPLADCGFGAVEVLPRPEGAAMTRALLALAE